MTVHNHPPNEPICKEWPTIDGTLRGECMDPQPVYGMCTACFAVEVELVRITGYRDLSHIGEHHAFPTGYGCEVCS